MKFMAVLAGLIMLIALASMTTKPSVTAIARPTPAPPAPKILPLPKVEITRWIAPYGTIAKMSFKISNVTNESWISDIKVECAFKGKSGTTIHQKSETIFDTIKPGQSLAVKDINFGFINQQVSSATCGAIAAKACCQYEVGL